VPETRINISDLKSEGGDTIKDLVDFVKEKTKADVETTTDEIVLEGEGRTTSRNYIRVVLRKFLHQQGLRDYFRVIGGKEDCLVVKEIKIEEEE
jgi:hypothetical protein